MLMLMLMMMLMLLMMMMTISGALTLKAVLRVNSFLPATPPMIMTASLARRHVRLSS
jgi:hypothetical protein